MISDPNSRLVLGAGVCPGRRGSFDLVCPELVEGSGQVFPILLELLNGSYHDAPSFRHGLSFTKRR